MQTCIHEPPSTLDPIARLEALEARISGGERDTPKLFRTDFDGGTEECLMDSVFVNLRSGDIVVLRADERAPSFVVPLRKHIGWLRGKARVYRMDFGSGDAKGRPESYLAKRKARSLKSASLRSSMRGTTNGGSGNQKKGGSGGKKRGKK